jgi:Polysaccharide lyase
MVSSKNWSILGLWLALTFSGIQSSIGATATSSAPLVFLGDFEGATLRPFIASGNAPTVTSEKTRAGHYAIKSVLNRLNSPISFRTEATTTHANAKYFSDTWYGLSVFLPKSYISSPVWEIVFQWHGVPDNPKAETLNPPMSMHTGNGAWLLGTVGDSRKPASKANYESKDKYPLGSYAADMGRWTDWVFHIRWDYRKVGSGNDGQLQVWKNGALVINASPIQLGFNDSVGPYFKMGLYKGWRDRAVPADTVSERVLYHDEFRQAGAGGSYASVAPPGSKSVVTPAAPTSIVVQ